MNVIGAITITAALVTMVAVLGGLARITPIARLRLFAFAGIWLAIITTVGALGGFAVGALGPVPGPVVAFLALLAGLFGTWNVSSRFRDGLMSIPLPALVGLNIGRLAGVYFLLLAAAGRLSNPFAASAGWGDIAVGAFALVLTVLLVTGNGSGRAVRVWNILGAADLIVAVSLGTLSAQGAPWRVFTQGPGSLAITELPWVMIPTILVPVFLLIHLTVAKKLKAQRLEAGTRARSQPSPAGIAG